MTIVLEQSVQKGVERTRSPPLQACGHPNPATTKPLLIPIFGLPGAGKSTLCNQLAEIASRGAQHKVDKIVFDELGVGWTVPVPTSITTTNNNATRDELKANESSKSISDTAIDKVEEELRFREARKEMLTKLDSLLSNASQTSVLGTNSPNRVIFLDDNLYYASMRLEVYKIAWNCGFLCLEFGTWNSSRAMNEFGS